MASKLPRRMTLRRKLHVMRTLSSAKTVKKRSIIIDAFLHIHKLQLKLEAIEREYLYVLKHIQEVKVEKVGENFLVKVNCKKGKERLVSILESFEQMGLNVLHARVSCSCFLSMEAIVEAQGSTDVIRDITQAVHKAIGRTAGVVGTQNSVEVPACN